MHKYKIPKQEHSISLGVSAVFKGTVVVDFPKASISIPTHVTGCRSYTYKVKLNPEVGKWKGEDSHEWTLANYKVVVRLRIDPAKPRYVLAELLYCPDNKKPIRWWHDKFDIYDPYKERKVEMFAQGAFIEPIKSNADHTYAVGYDDDGKRSYLWPCGGDHDEKQRSIGVGKAFQPECDCLSQMRTDPVTKGLAGIRYGLDGVCHQATNRILCTAKLEVNDAAGYKSEGWKYLTYWLYGRLGLKAIDGEGAKKWHNICKACLTKNHPFCSEETALLTSVDDHPGLQQTHIDDAQMLVGKTRHDLLDHYKSLAAGNLRPSEYTDKINAAINGQKAELLGVLGAELHTSVFQELASVDVVVAEPAIAEFVFANGASYP